MNRTVETVENRNEFKGWFGRKSRGSSEGNGKAPAKPLKRKSTTELDTLLWRLRARADFHPGHAFVVGLTSLCRKSGVSTTVANLAVRASDHNMGPVLLIDGNIGAPRVHRIFRCKGKVGITDVLTGSSSPSEALQKTRVDGLDILPLGASGRLDGSRILPQNYAELITWARQHYQLVFVDLPAVDELRHSLMLARLTDTTLLAVRSEAVHRREAQDAVERLKADGVNLGGCLLTRKRIYTPRFLRW